MAEGGGDFEVSVLPEQRWERSVRTAPPLPFGSDTWLNLGLAQQPDLRLIRAAVRCGSDGDLLVPLCLAADRRQVGCLGYGGFYPGQRWRDGRLPEFGQLAGALCGFFGLTSLHTLIPPSGLVGHLDEIFSTAPVRTARPTFLLELSGGRKQLWSTAKGSSRTAVRRAQTDGLTALPLEYRHAPAVCELYAETLSRNDTPFPYSLCDIEAVIAEVDRDAATGVLVTDGAGRMQAVSVFAVAAGIAYHMIQATSSAGQLSNAGHLALWTVLARLADCGVARVDLGSAANAGQRQFKLAWGAYERNTRLVQWPAPNDGDGRE